jgi:hypothetical protein
MSGFWVRYESGRTSAGSRGDIPHALSVGYGSYAYSVTGAAWYFDYSGFMNAKENPGLYLGLDADHYVSRIR